MCTRSLAGESPSDIALGSRAGTVGGNDPYLEDSMEITAITADGQRHTITDPDDLPEWDPRGGSRGVIFVEERGTGGLVAIVSTMDAVRALSTLLASAFLITEPLNLGDAAGPGDATDGQIHISALTPGSQPAERAVHAHLANFGVV